MLTDLQVITLLQRSKIVTDLYDSEMDKIATQNNGKYKLDESTQLEVAVKAFNKTLGEETNVSWGECCAIFDLINRGN